MSEKCHLILYLSLIGGTKYPVLLVRLSDKFLFQTAPNKLFTPKKQVSLDKIHVWMAEVMSQISNQTDSGYNFSLLLVSLAPSHIYAGDKCRPELVPLKGWLIIYDGGVVKVVIRSARRVSKWRPNLKIGECLGKFIEL